ncbi:lysozyme C-like [Condylostylus longicornis]|uniref:lysozyme C-like n=1 Tax=Condylostylus longicornis TaxID=2530218 RepID=UPI00244DB7D6|nr:lysozyme C-like [Condylostylus longicornis]
MLSVKRIIIAINFVCILCLANAKVFQRCELARELLQHDVSKDDILDWVCIAEFESSFRTEAINYNNWDGSWDWGLFQLNDRYWCDGGKQTANVCKTSCNDFLTDDISAAFNCARIIKNAHSHDHNGFGAWVAWKTRCQGWVESKQQTQKCLI